MKARRKLMQRRPTRYRVAFAVLALALAVPALVPSSGAAQTHEHGALHEIEVVVDGGYKPNRIEIHEGERVRLKFVRKDYSSCTREVVFPKLNIRRELPTNQPVVIELPALAAGEYEFRCGMNMIRGTLVVTSHG
jgi:plastocyanin domain-containing protein